MAQQWRARARLSALLTVAAILLGSARAGKGPPMSTLEVVHSVEHLEEIIFSDRVSVILFTEGEDDTEESKWFMYFSAFWKPVLTGGLRSAAIMFAMCDAAALRRAGRAGAEGIWLFAKHDSWAALRYEKPIASEADVDQALSWIEAELMDARCVEADGSWRKAPSSYVHDHEAPTHQQDQPHAKDEL